MEKKGARHGHPIHAGLQRLGRKLPREGIHLLLPLLKRTVNLLDHLIHYLAIDFHRDLHLLHRNLLVHTPRQLRATIP